MTKILSMDKSKLRKCPACNAQKLAYNYFGKFLQCIRCGYRLDPKGSPLPSPRGLQ